MNEYVGRKSDRSRLFGYDFFDDFHSGRRDAVRKTQRRQGFAIVRCQHQDAGIEVVPPFVVAGGVRQKCQSSQHHDGALALARGQQRLCEQLQGLEVVGRCFEAGTQGGDRLGGPAAAEQSLRTLPRAGNVFFLCLRARTAQPLFDLERNRLLGALPRQPRRLLELTLRIADQRELQVEVREPQVRIDRAGRDGEDLFVDGARLGVEPLRDVGIGRTPVRVERRRRVRAPQLQIAQQLPAARITRIGLQMRLVFGSADEWVMQAERRRSTRVPARFLVEWDAGEFFAPAEAADVSPHGLAIETPRPGQVAQLIRIRLHLPDCEAPLECYAWIRWQRDGLMGLQLFAMSEAERNRWASFYLDCYRQVHRQAA
jgi:hypothetical protein